MLLPCVSIIFVVTYWAEKWELLKLSRVPQPYAADLAALTGKHPSVPPPVVGLVTSCRA